MQWKPNVTVAAVAVQDDRFLIVEENSKGHIVFNQPAGHLEQNETLIDAVKREVLEETAWSFKPDCIVGIYLYTNPREDITYLRICFAGVCTQHFPGKELDAEILRAVWLTKDELESRKDRMRSDMVLRCINDYISGHQYPLQILNHFL
jgi:ADP-ribose pyrophosphatase YjhB (NUDIX family)